MSELRLRLDAPIVPDEGLGGLHLRMEIRAYQDHLVDLGLIHEGSFELASPIEALYRIGRGEVEIAVDVRNGRIFKLIAGSGYRGTLFGRVRVGMTAREAMCREPRLDFDEAEGGLICRDVDGLHIGLGDPDPPAKLVPDLTIETICVFAKEIVTLQGQEGDWSSLASRFA